MTDMKRYLFIAIAVTAAAALFGKVQPPIESARKAIEFKWLAPEEPFMLGGIVFFDCFARNVSSDSAIVYELDPATVRMDSIEPFVMVKPYEPYPNDTLAPGDTAHYRYILSDGPNWFYDPYFGSRSYDKKVGLSCLPPGEYRLVYRKNWNTPDSLFFEIVDPPATERALLDSLAMAYVYYQVERFDDAVSMGFYLAGESAGSPYAARGIIFARGVAWENDMCDEALALDSIFWVNFGEPAVRRRYLPYPGILRATGGVIGKCVPKEERSAYLDRLETMFSDPEMACEIDGIRAAFGGEKGCEGCGK